MFRLLLFCGIFSVYAFAKAQTPKYQGQGPTQIVPTDSKPTQRQWKGTYHFDSVHFSNDFQGGRLNGIIENEDASYTALITSENTPVNMSPWYAFKVWSAVPQEVDVVLTYEDGAKHRYWPKLSQDRRQWKSLDSLRVTEYEKGDAAFGGNSLPVYVKMKLQVGPDTLWVAAQELETSHRVYNWIDERTEKKNVLQEVIGQSNEGRLLKALTIGKPKSKHMIMVISRQHPPEVTGYLAMKSFVETLTSDSKLARKFRRKFTTYVVPLINPDGVDNGHWRHNSGGVDLNRDWQNFNQPETRAVRDFMQRRVEATGGKFYFGIDFHSTWDDIYYTMDDSFKGNMPGLVPDWLDAIKKEMPDYDPNIKPSTILRPHAVSRNFFFAVHGAESLVFEIGDNTDRTFIKEKGRIGAEQLMRLLLEGVDD